jgi:hypothetical protein
MCPSIYIEFFPLSEVLFTISLWEAGVQTHPRFADFDAEMDQWCVMMPRCNKNHLHYFHLVLLFLFVFRESIAADDETPTKRDV